MNLAAFVDWFIHPNKKLDFNSYRRSRLFVRASLLTSLFSNSYIWLSVYFEFGKGVQLMVFNVVGFLLLSFLAKTKLRIKLLGHIYVLFGAVAVIVLTYYSGGVWSAIYPWIIAIPVLALLVVDKQAGIFWCIIAFVAMAWFATLANMGVVLPAEYNTEMRTLWYTSIVPGLLLIIMLISFVFEASQRRALDDLERQNHILEEQKETIERQSAALEKALDEKDHIIRILAHDLKNPLTSISFVSNMLGKKEKDAQQQQEFITLIEEVSSRALGLVDRVLKMAILEQGSIRLNLERLRILEAVNEAINELKAQATRKSIVISVDSKVDSCEVEADKTYLLLIFENLLSNALKFSEKETNVKVEVNQVADKVHIYVKDQGPGVLLEEENLLFEKFTKLSARPTWDESSSGLGLSLVKRYVEEMKGKIWYQRDGSEGATFVVELPIAS